MVTLKSCPVCGSQDIAESQVILGGELIVELLPGVQVNGTITTRYCVCQSCNLIFQNPRMSDTELDKYYGSGYYRKTVNQPPEGMEESESDRAKIDSEIVKKYIGGVTSHLDIGCGRGYFLKEVGAAFKVGVESDVNYVKAEDVKVYGKMNQISRKAFDLVTAIHVLEHVPYPLDYLKNMIKLMDMNGHLIIEVPSRKTRGGPLGLAHLHYFEPDVLKLMCKQVGLYVEGVEFTPHLVLICRSEN